MENSSHKSGRNHSKISGIVLSIIFSVFKNLLKLFCRYIRMENPSYKSKNVVKKYLNNMWKNRFLKVKNSILELERDFTELKDRVLKDREVKNKREIEELFFKLIIVSSDEMDKFQQKQMKKIRPIKNTWYYWLINYILDPITCEKNYRWLQR